jgi:hypothetical protein
MPLATINEVRDPTVRPYYLSGQRGSLVWFGLSNPSVSFGTLAIIGFLFLLTQEPDDWYESTQIRKTAHRKWDVKHNPREIYEHHPSKLPPLNPPHHKFPKNPFMP